MFDPTTPEHVKPTIFTSEEEALNYLYEFSYEEECCDNFRFAYCDDLAGMAKYERQICEGCCGFCDVEVYILSGNVIRMAHMGFNYGH
jgi:hypothetical protein